MYRLLYRLYRVIRILSCVWKMYSSSLSSIFVSYGNLYNILVDEENCYKSCKNPIFSPPNIIHNRLNNGKPTFLDMEKTFDKVDRNLILLRLLQYGIDDKM